MANVYIEARPKGRPEGSAIEDFVVEDHADHVLATFKTQREALTSSFSVFRHQDVLLRHAVIKKLPTFVT